MDLDGKGSLGKSRQTEDVCRDCGPLDSIQRTNLSVFVLYSDSQEQDVRSLARIKSQGHMGFESEGLKFELLA